MSNPGVQVGQICFRFVNFTPVKGRAPEGSDGLPVPGEHANADRIAYEIPDATGPCRNVYPGRRVLVVGRRHQAIKVALALMELQESEPRTQIFQAPWRDWNDKPGGWNNALAERGAPGHASPQVQRVSSAEGGSGYGRSSDNKAATGAAE